MGREAGRQGSEGTVRWVRYTDPAQRPMHSIRHHDNNCAQALLRHHPFAMRHTGIGVLCNLLADGFCLEGMALSCGLCGACRT